ncbi:epoxyqueuosine reductase QueH [Oleidesulfovibrio alaskensis]|uniref:epoxyqueuosine reductase QueH n=1 Tax=Oleidesulfovibrio alaskensis TaxID=58180 RepID=UPI001A521647|nr:epoxyqueuosine reductase QueH [Oleidesulfovibrio alaskensis]MBL3583111.1 epoxyqueuosine reductase QueH [Oleidesulfovibrio alaskensis]
MARVLVHACCGPCSITTMQTLLREGHEVTGLFFNPNIHPLREYLARRQGMVDVAHRLGVKVIYFDREYDPQAWMREIAFREANRCFHCYRIRLERAVSVARRGGFDMVTSTLLYSRKQQHERIAALGSDLCGDGRLRFLYRDFREGWQQGIETSKAWGIYRQQYCGCLYSETERYARELKNAGAQVPQQTAGTPCCAEGTEKQAEQAAATPAADNAGR